MALQEGIGLLSLPVLAKNMAAFLPTRPGITKRILQGESLRGEVSVNHFRKGRIVVLFNLPRRQGAAA